MTRKGVFTQEETGSAEYLETLFKTWQEDEREGKGIQAQTDQTADVHERAWKN